MDTRRIVRVVEASEYDRGEGFVVEYNYGGDTGWAIPAWEEWGYSEREGVFPTRAEAEAALLEQAVS